MASGTVSENDDGERGLIFQWERRSRGRWRLALMLALSLLAHAASFYVFQVAYTPTGTQLPPPAQVVYVPLDRPENASLARWLAMNDPALTVRPAGPSAAQVLASLGFHYVPSYNAAQPPFKPLGPAEDAVNTVPPRANPPGPVPLPPLAAPAAAASRASGAGGATRVVLNGAVGLTDGTALPPVRFKARAGASVLEPAVFLVGVRAEGGEPFLFRQASSGDAAADEYARGYLAGMEWKGATPDVADGVSWGTASFCWGNDVYR